MTVTAVAPAIRARLVTPALLRVFVAEFGALTSFYLLLSVVPLYASSIRVGGDAAGLATGALMLCTVAAELLASGALGLLYYGPRRHLHL